MTNLEISRAPSQVLETWTVRKSTGVVRTGKGDLAQRMNQLEELYRTKTGMDLVAGSLNVLLQSSYSVPVGAIRIEPGEGGCAVGVSILPCKINDRAAFIVRTDKNESGTGDHPKEIIEVICDVHLRKLFGLNDGDSVSIELYENAG